MRNLQQALGGLPEPVQPVARAILERERAIADRLGPILATKLKGATTRVHGDLHLDQVLIADGDYVFIDFEGEAERPIGERTLKYSPLRDVAMLLCSYQCAAYVALGRRVSAVEAEQAPLLQVLTPWVRDWSFWVSVAFLQGYLETAHGAAFLPRDRHQVAALLDVYLLESGLAAVAEAVGPGASHAGATLQAFLDLVARPVAEEVPVRG
jgi:maltose alpha-D-glucosyltransferase/alpha-amylase